MTALAAALMLVQAGQNSVKRAQAEAKDALYRWEQVRRGEQTRGEVTWDPDTIGGRVPDVGTAGAALMFIGAPGIPTAMVSAVLAYATGIGDLTYIGWCVGIAMFWYALGLHVDQLQNCDSDLPRAAPLAIRVYLKIARGASPLVLFLVSISFFFDRHGSFAGNNLFMGAALICWCMWGTWTLRKKPQPDAPLRLLSDSELQ